MTFDATIHAEYSDINTVRQSQEKRGERSLVLVEGSFDTTDELMLHEVDDAPETPGTLVEAWGLELPADTGWTGMARLVRGQVLQLKSQEYIVAAEAMGAKSSRIIAKHLIPNALSVIIINVTLAIPSAIFTEAFLSYIGLGVPVPQPSWGVLAKGGQDVFMTYPYQLVVPAVAISLTMLSFNLLGDGLRDAFDPRLRR